MSLFLLGLLGLTALLSIARQVRFWLSNRSRAMTGVPPQTNPIQFAPTIQAAMSLDNLR